MKKDENIFKNTFTSVNESESNIPKKSLRDRIRDLIIKNDLTIKKYEKLKEKSNNSQKKMDYLKMISKFRTRQISLQNKLHSLNLIMNPYVNNYPNNILKQKTQNEKIIKSKFTLHKKINSSDNNSNYSIIYTNNNIVLTNKKSEKKNSKVNSTNDLNKYIPKPTKISYIIPDKKIENKNQNNNNKNTQAFNNAKKFFRVNTNTNENINDSSRYKNNNLYINANNKESIIKNLKNDKKNNIIIINNINNFYGKVENINKINIKTTEHIINQNMRKKIKERILKNETIDIDEQINKNKDNLTQKDENIKEKEFKLTPNLVFKKRIMKIKKNVVIEIFHLINNKNKVYVAMSEKSFLGYNIKIFKFKKRKFVTRLKRHKNKIIAIKYFFNKQKFHDYLISGDISQIINIWDISCKYSMNQFLYLIKYDGERIYNFLPLSIELKDNKLSNYLLVYDKSISMYDLRNGIYLKTINHNRLLNEKITNLTLWKNKKNNFDYILNCTEYKIIIYNFIDSEIYFILSDYSNNEDKIKYITEGCISSNNNNEYLCIFSYSTYLLNIYFEIWDLYELNLKEKIMMKTNLINDAYLLNIIPWNYKYILFSDGDKNFIYVIDLEIKKIINKIHAKSTNDMNHVYFKKIKIKEFGESLIVWKHNSYMSLFTIK